MKTRETLQTRPSVAAGQFLAFHEAAAARVGHDRGKVFRL